MTSLFNIFLILHIAGGFTGLLVGSFILFRKKGDQLHKNTGRLFYWGMVVAGASSLILSILHPNSFLFMIGLFTLYMTLTGVRYNHHRLTLPNQLATPDRLLLVMMGGGSLFLIIIGLFKLFHGDTFGIALLFFSLAGIQFIRQDLANFKNPSAVKFLQGHIARMTGSYISALTAFLVVNFDRIPLHLPAFIVWLAPSAILTPLIFRWSKKYGPAKKELV